MEKLKIAIIKTGNSGNGDDLLRSVYEDPALLELCTPVVLEKKAALRDLDEGKVAAVVLASTEPAECPAGAFEVIATDKTNIMPLAKEPTAEDIVKFRDMLERDFDLRSPRIAIVHETAMQNPDLASQVTEEQGINTYGPYTVEQLFAEDMASHFDGIITADKALAQHILAKLPLEASVRFFAGREAVVTAVCQPAQTNEAEEGMADVSWLTHPIYIAIDVIRNRASYDEARQNPLPKLYRDKREDRRGEKDAPKGTE